MALYSHQISLSGFSQSQIDAFMTLFGVTLSTIETPEPPPAPYTSDQQQPPKQAQPSKQKQEHKPLQQAIAEKTAEKHTEKVVSSSNVTTATTSLRSTVLHQATKQTCREATFRLSNAPPLVTLPTILTSLFASLHGYIHQAEDMEATGQG